jgi:hypothetical protein
MTWENVFELLWNEAIFVSIRDISWHLPSEIRKSMKTRSIGFLWDDASNSGPSEYEGMSTD